MKILDFNKEHCYSDLESRMLTADELHSRYLQLKEAAQTLALEAIHYRDSGKGEQFLTDKINKVLEITKIN